MSDISLKSLVAPSKTVEVEYPGMPEFKIQLSFLSRDTLQKLRKKATKTTFKNRQPVEELNDELFLELYVKSSVLGWSGLKLKYAEQLMPLDLGDQDPELEVDFSEEQALLLMKSSLNFDSFVSEKVTDLGNFLANK